MKQTKRLGFLLFAAVLAVPGMAPAQTSETKVKGSATASKIAADGKQTVMITLNVDKGWYIYANPLNANTKTYDGNETVVAIKGKDKIQAAIKYPVGVKHKDGKHEYDIYQGQVVIEAQVQRQPGDMAPLKISIDVNACTKGVCLLQGTLELTVP